MRSISHLSTGCLLALILVMTAPARPAVAVQAGQEAAQAETLIKQGREAGITYLNQRDDKAKDTAKKSLERAEKLMKEQLKKQPDCEKCYELLAECYLYRSYFGFARDYDKSIETADKGLKLFPANNRLSLIKGYAHYNCDEYDQALRALNRYILAASGDPAVEQARQVQAACQQKFLINWNRQANYYQSRESRIESFNPQTGKMEVAFQVTPEFELNLGSQGFAALTAQAQPFNDPEIQNYLQNLVDRIVTRNPGSSFTYKLTLINSPEVNAVTPPGHIIVYLGLLNFAENESELAAILSHELAHNYAHHHARAVIKSYLAQNVAGAIIGAISPQGALKQTLAQFAASLGINLFMRAYSRFEEKEADLYGSHILFNAGYDPTAFSMVFTKMYKLSPKQPVKFLSTHPPTPDRATYMIDYVEAFPFASTEVKTDSAEFQKIKAKLKAIMPAAPAQKLPGKGVIPPH